MVLTLLASVAVHVRLQRARSREGLVADPALVLPLRAAGYFGAERAHHVLEALGSRGHQALGTR